LPLVALTALVAALLPPVPVLASMRVLMLTPRSPLSPLTTVTALCVSPLSAQVCALLREEDVEQKRFRAGFFSGMGEALGRSSSVVSNP
jgi:hypothetical protein